jgi:Rrf2 family protein
MLKLSKKVDYGLVLLSELHNGSGPASAREMAERYRLPQPMAANILKALAAGGIVTSTRGAQGGYTLARSASEISLADVVEALEGPLSLLDCTEQGGGCEHQPACPTTTPIQRVARRFRLFMAGYMLDEVLGRAQPRTRFDFDLASHPMQEGGAST